ncbi:Transmembrane protein PFT27 [Microdochium nivale]|nr:Transmembrane protein PFT27 [Microdochium nivale]
MKPKTQAKHLLLLMLPSIALASTDIDARLLDSSAPGSVKKITPIDGKDGMPHNGPWVSTGRTDGPSDSDAADTYNPKGKPMTMDGVEIPQTNDGVMDDPARRPPKKGTTGMEGGVSEKEKLRKAQEGKTGERVEKIPETPKEDPRLSGSKNKAPADSDSAQTADEIAGLEKPLNLPDKIGGEPHPIPDSANKQHLNVDKGSSSSHTKTPTDADAEGLIQPFHSFVLSLTMILVSEVGDKTFLVACLMAMKHDRMVVFTAAFGALAVMTVLSAVLGHSVPALISKRVTAFLAAGLFFVFGAKLLREGLEMDPNEGVSGEMQEVEMELAEKEQEALKQGGRQSSASAYALEGGLGRHSRKSRSQSRFPSPPRSPSTSPARSPSPRGGMLGGVGSGVSNLFSLLLSPAWVQTFVMTFLGEWGDRSQIATIAMAAGQDYWWVTLGALVGHSICTGAAVIGGRAIAGRVSLKKVTMGGAIAFLVFGFIYAFEALYA